MDRLFITVNDIAALKCVSYKTACKFFNNIVKKYDLPKEREISIQSFCDYYRVSEEKVIAILDKKQKVSSTSKTMLDSV